MDKEQAAALYEKLPLKIRFTSYFKYSFSFAGENEVLTANLSFGGSADDIYRAGVDNDEFEAPKTFEELLVTYNWIKLTDKKTGELFELYDY